MCETIVLHDVVYTVEQTDTQIHLQRYNDQYKMWVNLYFPKGKKMVDDLVIDLLSDLYIKRRLENADVLETE